MHFYVLSTYKPLVYIKGMTFCENDVLGMWNGPLYLSYWGPMWPFNRYFQTFKSSFLILFSLSFTFPSSAIQPSASLPLYLPSWWYSQVLVAIEKSSRETMTQVRLLLTGIFTFGVLLSCFCLNTQHHTGLKAFNRHHTYTPGRIHVFRDDFTVIFIVLSFQRKEEKEQDVWTRLLFKHFTSTSATPEVPIRVLWVRLYEFLNNWVQSFWWDSTDRRKTSLCTPPYVISLTHAIKDYHREQITNPVPLALAPPHMTHSEISFHYVVQTTICSLCSPQFAAMQEKRGMLQVLP